MLCVYTCKEVHIVVLWRHDNTINRVRVRVRVRPYNSVKLLVTTWAITWGHNKGD